MNRWLTSYEALLAQGFPIRRELSFGVAVSSFSDDITELESDHDRCGPTAAVNRTARIGQAGNAMHVEVIAIMLAYIVSYGGATLEHMHDHCSPKQLVKKQQHHQLAPSLLRAAALVKGIHSVSRSHRHP